MTDCDIFIYFAIFRFIDKYQPTLFFSLSRHELGTQQTTTNLAKSAFLSFLLKSYRTILFTKIDVLKAKNKTKLIFFKNPIQVLRPFIESLAVKSEFNHFWPTCKFEFDQQQVKLKSSI